jgi:hypothetical protein
VLFDCRECACCDQLLHMRNRIRIRKLRKDHRVNVHRVLDSLVSAPRVGGHSTRMKASSAGGNFGSNPTVFTAKWMRKMLSCGLRLALRGAWRAMLAQSFGLTLRSVSSTKMIAPRSSDLRRTYRMLTIPLRLLLRSSRIHKQVARRWIGS